MRRPQVTTSITLRIPDGLLKRIDQAAETLRLRADKGELPDDTYGASRSAIMRYLITAGLRAFKTNASTARPKR